MEIVKMEHVTKIYGEGDTRVWGLDDVSLTIDKGEIVAISGGVRFRQIDNAACHGRCGHT